MFPVWPTPGCELLAQSLPSRGVGLSFRPCPFLHVCCSPGSEPAFPGDLGLVLGVPMLLPLARAFRIKSLESRSWGGVRCLCPGTPPAFSVGGALLGVCNQAPEPRARPRAQSPPSSALSCCLSGQLPSAPPRDPAQRLHFLLAYLFPLF